MAGVASLMSQFLGGRCFRRQLASVEGPRTRRGFSGNWPAEGVAQRGTKAALAGKSIGSGYSTPAVVGERLYLLSNQGMENEFVKALNVKDGKEIWSTRLGKVGNPNQKPSYPAARSTPTLDGDFLYALGSDGDLVCLERSSGRVRWQKEPAYGLRRATRHLGLR